MIQVGAYDDVFVFPHRVATLEYADHIFAVAGFALDRDIQAEFLLRAKLKRILLRARSCAIEDLRRIHFLALENAVGHSHIRDH